MNNQISDARLEELKRGFSFDAAAGCHACIFCGERFPDGEVFKADGRMFTAEKAAERHVEAEHGSAFDALIAQDKKYTGLTDVQKELMAYFYGGLGDKEIAALTRTSASTVRYQRYKLRERAKQARVFLALEELMEEGMRRKPEADETLPVHESARQVDERFMITQAESDDIIARCFDRGDPPRLLRFPPKEKKKVVILRVFAARFAPGEKYTEREVNARISEMYGDYVTIRRYLIEYGFMDRTPDGAQYWLL
ncbi:MAG: DUF2087 domain-containing protein [Oscillospiraceae bacterium]|jgi:DNA-binding CsgD family transcriptional regulator|nr:DUF2087 domain-containing protein [Oscillospiraceae bacterium]